MPLLKRVVYDPVSYHNKNVFEESTPDSFLQDHSMSRMLGTMNQLAYFSSFALEIFQNLSILTEDLHDRVKIATARTSSLYGSLKAVDRQVASIDDDSHVSAVPGMSKFLQSREMFTPQLFNKATNYCSISQQYRICRAPPQLWRIEAFTQEDCFKNYSNPGFFFQEWIRSEIIRQQYKKEEKKRNKLLKKQQRHERKKLKEAAAEEELYNTMYSSANVSANASANVSLSGVTDKRNKSMLVLHRDGDRRAGHAVAEEDEENGGEGDETAQAQHGGPGGADTAEEFDEEKDAEESAIASAAALAASAKAKGKEGKKSQMQSLAKLFSRKPKTLFPNVDEDAQEESHSPPAAGQASSKAESLSLQMLSIPDKPKEKEKGRKARTGAAAAAASSGDEGMEEERAARERAERLQEARKKAAARPMSYMDELAAGAHSARRQSVLLRDRDVPPLMGDPADAADTGYAAMEEEESAGFLAPKIDAEVPFGGFAAGRHGKKNAPPATMKIGSKFLSSTVVGGKPATSTTAAVLTVGENEAPTSHGHTQQRRGSSNKVHVGADLAASAENGTRAHSGSIDWETQRHTSQGNLLIKPPPPPPPPAASLLDSKESLSGKRASFSSTAKGGDGAESRLLAGKHRLSFALPRSAAPAADMFERSRGRGDPWEEDSDAGLMASGNARRKSLLSKLQEEVFEEISGEELRLSQQESHMADVNAARGESAHREHDVEDVPEDDAEDEADDAPQDDDEEPTPQPEDGSEGSPPPSDGESEPEEDPEDEPAPPPRPSARPGPPPPPPPPPPAPVPMKSPLSEGLLGALKGGGAGSGLKKVDAPVEPKMDERTQLLRSIQLGSVQLKSNAAKAKPFQKIEVKVRPRQRCRYAPDCALASPYVLSFSTAKRGGGGHSGEPVENRGQRQRVQRRLGLGLHGRRLLAQRLLCMTHPSSLLSAAWQV
jgi:hypothetical protein